MLLLHSAVLVTPFIDERRNQITSMTATTTETENVNLGVRSSDARFPGSAYEAVCSVLFAMLAS